jgi:hypothetical protein
VIQLYTEGTLTHFIDEYLSPRPGKSNLSSATSFTLALAPYPGYCTTLSCDTSTHLVQPSMLCISPTVFVLSFWSTIVAMNSSLSSAPALYVSCRARRSGPERDDSWLASISDDSHNYSLVVHDSVNVRDDSPFTGYFDSLQKVLFGTPFSTD